MRSVDVVIFIFGQCCHRGNFAVRSVVNCELFSVELNNFGLSRHRKQLNIYDTTQGSY